MATVDYDVLIIGAGLSGIGAAVHLQKKCPGKSYAILEARESMGGTWDLFRYPGIRSDSDMHTLGYGFKPWIADKAIADGPAILSYVRETASEYGVQDQIRYQHKLLSADWSSDESHWRVVIDTPSGEQRLTCRWLHMCAGYYRYDEGYLPEFRGRESFKGDILHPQHWPEDYDYTGKRVVIIGSGATAVTLLPSMTEKASHVTMLQRSPTYFISQPSEDGLANRLRKLIPTSLAYAITRWKNVLRQQYVYKLTRRRPQLVKKKLIGMVEKEIGAEVDIEKDFTPNYNPWDQRLCLVPDSDFFEAIKSGKASVVTDAIKQFTAGGIELTSGEMVEADLIITATGLDLQFLGGATLRVDGLEITPHDHLNYKGCMISGVPNLTNVFGYTNASWTLRADLISTYMCRLLNYLDQENFVESRPIAENVEADEGYLDLTSGYVQRSVERFPKNGLTQPWMLKQDYTSDLFLMRYGRINDGALVFRRETRPSEHSALSAAAAAE